jgi:hypothetical protein
MTGNTLFSNEDVIEWNGKTYDFAAWNSVVPGNFWGTAGIVVAPTPTSEVAGVPPTTTKPTPLELSGYYFRKLLIWLGWVDG